MSDAIQDEAGSGAQDAVARAPGFFAEPGMDRFVSVILNMASEMWVMKEQLRALEPEAAGPDSEAGAAAFIERIFAPLREKR